MTPDTPASPGSPEAVKLGCKCPACGSKQDSADFGKRVFFACDSFGYVGENKLAYQTDLCRAWQTLNRIQTIATTDHESKQAFIDRVTAILNER